MVNQFNPYVLPRQIRITAGAFFDRNGYEPIALEGITSYRCIEMSDGKKIILIGEHHSSNKQNTLVTYSNTINIVDYFKEYFDYVFHTKYLEFITRDVQQGEDVAL